MPAVSDAHLAFAHRLVCAAVIAHGDRGGGELLLRRGATAIHDLLPSAEGVRLLREHAWPDEPDIAANTVDVYIGYLRRKLGPDTIRTVRGVGYKLDPEAAEALR